MEFIMRRIVVFNNAFAAKSYEELFDCFVKDDDIGGFEGDVLNKILQKREEKEDPFITKLREEGNYYIYTYNRLCELQDDTEKLPCLELCKFIWYFVATHRKSAIEYFKNNWAKYIKTIDFYD